MLFGALWCLIGPTPPMMASQPQVHTCRVWQHLLHNDFYFRHNLGICDQKIIQYIHFVMSLKRVVWPLFIALQADNLSLNDVTAVYHSTTRIPKLTRNASENLLSGCADLAFRSSFPFLLASPTAAPFIPCAGCCTRSCWSSISTEPCLSLQAVGKVSQHTNGILHNLQIKCT